MLARQLPNSPKAEELAANVAMMTRDLYAMGLHDFDDDRISQAMMTVAIDIGRWPTSHMIKKNLPPRTRHHYKALEHRFMHPKIRANIKDRNLGKQPNENPEDYAKRCLVEMRLAGKDGEKMANHLEKNIDQEAIDERKAIQEEANT